MAWTKLKPLGEGHYGGCLTCGPRPSSLKPSTVMAVGFGFVEVTKDGETVWSGDDEHVWLRRFERMAAADPDHDWRVWFNAPLSDREYQRQDGEWVLVANGKGFA